MTRSPDSFNQVAELYDEARPSYPLQLVDDLVSLADLGRGDRVLEIGCGTGQITVPLAERGLRITALEPGDKLATVARQRLGQFDDVEIVVNRFEDYELPDEPFDFVVSATAFHWVDPSVRVAKSAQALKVGGHLAVIHTHWGVGREIDIFFEQSQTCYQHWDPDTDPNFRPPTAGDISGSQPQLEESRSFGDIKYRQYEQRNRYSTASYLNLLRTFSNVNALDEEHRRGLLDCLGTLIDSRFHGSLRKSDLREMWVATREGRP
ncbi:MAG: class I SAM-dependent methyltransferase [Acidimicrobiales bacterium]